jgi:LysR family transcriptional regulator, regulatory protein for tcuABC
MELRQLRYFVRAVELGSISRAANDLHTVSSTLSQQISRLEGSLSTLLLQRTSRGVVPTEAGLEFFREAQLALRHVDQAASVAQKTRRSGRVSVGLASTTAAVLGMPLIRAMRERYPEVRLHLVEGMSGHLSSMLNARQLDLAVLFDIDAARRWSVTPLVEEKIFLIESVHGAPLFHSSQPVALELLQEVPLILPSIVHGLRGALNAAFARNGLKPNIVAEIDSLATLMDSVRHGLGATLQPWAAVARTRDVSEEFRLTEIADVVRVNSLCCLSDDELSLPALGARIVLLDCVREVIQSGFWQGTRSNLRDHAEDAARDEAAVAADRHEAPGR